MPDVKKDSFDYLHTEKERKTEVYFVHFEYGDGRPILCPLYALLLPQDRKLLRVLRDRNDLPVVAELKFRGRWRPILQAWRQSKAEGSDPAFAKAITHHELFGVIMEAAAGSRSKQSVK